MKPSRHSLVRLPTFCAKGVVGAAGVLSLALLAGCGGNAPTRPPQEDAQAKQFAARGYLSEEQYSFTTTPLSWNAQGQSFEFLLSVPVRPEPYPLILYFPGLGESRSAGDVWRNAWVQAGYAVISIQLLEEDSRVWASRDARNGDFTPLARKRFGPESMSQRQQALTSFIRLLKQKAAAGDPALSHVDVQHIALAGYDLGAYTAMVGAGEQYQTESVVSVPLGDLQAIIALSPYAGFSGPSFGQRYEKLNLPVLSITGQGDVDSFGLVSSAQVRGAPFQHMPAGGKYLLMLDDTSHDALAGTSSASAGKRAPAGSDDEDRRSRNTRSGGDEGPGGGRGGPGGGSGPGGNGGGRGGPGEGGFASSGRNERGDGFGSSAFSQSAIRSVTTAFLDSQLKDDPVAREWLRRDARRWLRDTAALTVR